jgi:hypothetical protein
MRRRNEIRSQPPPFAAKPSIARLPMPELAAFL